MKNFFMVFHETRSLSLRNYLVEINVGLARKVAHAAASSSNQIYEDMLAYATIGLIKAVERFNPQVNDYFSSFAMPYIRGEIQHYLRDKASVVRLHRKFQDLATKRENANRRLTRTLGRNPTKKELIRDLDISLKEFEEIEIAIKNRGNQLRLDMPIQGEDLMLLDVIPAKESVSYSSIEKVWLLVEKAISLITNPVVRRALSLIYLEDYEIKEAALILKISTEELSTLLIFGVELLSNCVDIPFPEIINLFSNFGEDSNIKETWHNTTILIDDYLQEEFYESLKIA
jgi:RNA polymerase sigma-B factor